MKKPVVSVVIASHNARIFLGPNLTSLFQEPDDFEVIVVDDGSTDGTNDFLQQNFALEPRLKVISLKDNQGSAKAKNIGARTSSGRYLFFLDADTKTQTGWRPAIESFFEKNPRTGLAQAKLLQMASQNLDYAGDLFSPLGFLVERARGAQDRGQFDKVEPIFGLKTAGAIMRRQVFEEINGFDEDFGIFWEDTDLAWRTWLAGWQVSFGWPVKVWHHQKPARFYEENKKAYRLNYFGCRNHLLTILKNLGDKRLVLALPIVVFSWLTLGLSFLLKLQPQKSWAILQGLFWNLRNLPTIWRKRKTIQDQRKIFDEQLFSKVGYRPSLGYYLGKARAYLTNRPF